MLQDMSFPELPFSGCLDLDTAHVAVAWLLVQIPRLACLVRLTGSDRSKNPAKHAAIAAAYELYNCSLNSCVENTIDHSSWITKSSNEAIGSPVPRSLEFSSVSAFILAVRFYLFRVFLCGLLQTLNKHHGALPGIDMAAVEAQDVASATTIAMCIQYAMRPGPSMPLTALAIALPLQLSIGAWNRLQRRQQRAGVKSCEQAVEMREWYMYHINYLVRMWRGIIATPERLGALCDMFAGGQAIEDACVALDRFAVKATEDLRGEWEMVGDIGYAR